LGRLVGPIARKAPLFGNGMTKRTWSKIAVMGAGAVGCYFGGMLARAGANVTLIGRPRHVDPINRDGLCFQSLDFQAYIPVAATVDVAAVREAQLVLFCVKSLDTEDAALKMAPYLAPDAVILSLQNGVDNVGRIRSHLKNEVICGLVYAAAQMPAPGCVTHTGGRDVIIGKTRESRGDDESDQRVLGEIARLLVGAGFRVKVSDDIEADLWTKLVMNCAYNAVCALSGAPYGVMVAMPEIRGVMRAVVEEVSRVAQARGVRLPDTMIETVFKLADAMPQTMSSTAQDIRNGKRTEIDHLNGYVVREGEALGIPTPVNRTLNALMKLLEQTKLGPSG